MEALVYFGATTAFSLKARFSVPALRLGIGLFRGRAAIPVLKGISEMGTCAGHAARDLAVWDTSFHLVPQLWTAFVYRVRPRRNQSTADTSLQASLLTRIRAGGRANQGFSRHRWHVCNVLLRSALRPGSTGSSAQDLV